MPVPFVSRASLVTYVSFASLAVLALLGYQVLRYPASLDSGGLPKALVGSGACAAYFIAARSVARREAIGASLRTGARAGMALGAIAIVGHTAEVFADLQAPIPAILGVSAWAVMFVLLGGASATTFRRDGSVACALLSSLWAGAISSITTVMFAFVIGLLFMDRMQQVLGVSLASAGNDGQVAVVRNLLDGASTHLVVAPVVALGAGTASVVVSLFLRLASRRTAAVLAAGAVSLVIAGVALLRVASSLERAARPPFVTSGLCALGVALTSAGPLAAAIRRRPASD